MSFFQKTWLLLILHNACYLFDQTNACLINKKKDFLAVGSIQSRTKANGSTAVQGELEERWSEIRNLTYPIHHRTNIML